MVSTRFLILALAVACPLTHAAAAEEVRLLPFWSQPYPSGYAARLPPCLYKLPVEIEGRIVYETHSICEPPLK